MAESKSLRIAYGEALAELGAENDKIVVLDRGRIVEQGTHEELTAKKGYYYELVQLQTGEDLV